ncbi:MAG: hypothetical protein WDO17_27140 [Alphaproteobacteria bacterium]
MQYRLLLATVHESRRQAIYVVRVQDEILPLSEIDEIAARMRERLDSRGEIGAEVVVVQGNSKATLRLVGDPYSVSVVRAAMFNASLGWRPLEPALSI